MKILVIPEDQTHDGHVIKPVLEALLADAGIPGRVAVLPEPRLRGASDALDQALIAQIVHDNPMEDVFVLVVDRDCNRASHESLAASREKEHVNRLLACLAKEEVEVWMLALHKGRLAESWKTVRDECDPKEKWAEPLLEALGATGPGAGRKNAMRALAGNYRSLKTLCPEIDLLQQRIVAIRQTGG